MDRFLNSKIINQNKRHVYLRIYPLAQKFYFQIFMCLTGTNRMFFLNGAQRLNHKPLGVEVYFQL